MPRARSPLNILAFHKLTPHFSYGVTNYSPWRFDKLLQGMIGVGYRLVSLEYIFSESSTYDKEIAVTFDDGYEHLREYLPPLMEKYDFTPTVFIPTYFMGKDNIWDYSSLMRKEKHLDLAGIRQLADLGVKFGSHGHSHIDLTRCSPVALIDELEQSKNRLEDILGQPILSLSYPFGRFNKAVIDTALRVGYQYCLSMKFPEYHDTDFSRGRFAVYGYDTLFSIIQKLQHGSLYRLEKLKARITNGLSLGTVLLNSLSSRTKN